MQDTDWFEQCGRILCYGPHMYELKIFLKKVITLLANLRIKMQSALHLCMQSCDYR